MFMLDGGGNIHHLNRRPANWEKLETWGEYHFIAEHRAWDADQCELVAQAIGLHDISPNAASLSGERRLKRRAKEFCRTGVLDLSADPC